eukprot:1152001-Pelagomonas_calceolata.AAC.5
MLVFHCFPLGLLKAYSFVVRHAFSSVEATSIPPDGTQKNNLLAMQTPTMWLDTHADPCLWINDMEPTGLLSAKQATSGHSVGHSRRPSLDK